MPTLQELTLALSRRLSEVYRARDARIAEALRSREARLRALPAVAKAYQRDDEQVADAREKQIALESKAQAARTGALLAAADRRSDRLDAAQLARRSADTAAVVGRGHAEEETDRAYRATKDGLTEPPSRDRDQVARDAEGTRRRGIENAARAHDAALDAAQQKYRGAVDEALVAERRDSRDGERAHHEALTLGESTARGGQAFAEQGLAEALSRIPDAVEIQRVYEEQLAAIAADTKQSETEAFERFRHDLESLKT